MHETTLGELDIATSEDAGRETDEDGLPVDS